MSFFDREVNHEFFSLTEDDLRKSDIPYMEIEFLNKWNFYAHTKDSRVWNDESFEHLCSFETIYEMWDSFNDITRVIDDDYMFFLARDGVSPSESNNEHTHLWWITISEETIGNETNALHAWLNIMISIVGQKIFKDYENYQDIINMMSVTKKYYEKGNRQPEYIFKIYVNKDVSDRNLYRKINLGHDNFLSFSKNGKFIENKREHKPMKVKRNNQCYRKNKK